MRFEGLHLKGDPSNFQRHPLRLERYTLKANKNEKSYPRFALTAQISKDIKRIGSLLIRNSEIFWKFGMDENLGRDHFNDFILDEKVE